VGIRIVILARFATFKVKNVTIMLLTIKKATANLLINNGLVLPGYNKKTNHFILPVRIQYIDYKQQLRHSDYVRTKFLKRHIYGYFYNNLRVNKTDKLTREKLNDYYRKERINRSIEYQKLIEENGWTKADLARHLGVSRAWVTIVMRELN
jgi:hypothetical protein